MGQDAGMFPRCSRASYHVARGSRDAIGRTRFDSSRRIDKLGDVLTLRASRAYNVYLSERALRARLSTLSHRAGSAHLRACRSGDSIGDITEPIIKRPQDSHDTRLPGGCDPWPHDAIDIP